MTPLFSDTGRRRLDQIIQPGLLCVFDFDGTLAPIVADPDAARLPAELLPKVLALQELVLVGILTGRSVDDVRRRVGFDADYLIGNHGIEGMPGWEDRAQHYAAMCAQWKQRLQEAMACGDVDGAGLLIEDKRHSLSVHYRHAPNPDAAAHQLRQVFARLSPAPRIIAGKAVFNLLPEDAADKGSALVQLMAITGASGAIYVGDDVTDEDAFRLRRPDLLSVRIEASPDSAADFFLERCDDISLLLDDIAARLRSHGAAVSRHRGKTGELAASISDPSAR